MEVDSDGNVAMGRGFQFDLDMGGVGPDIPGSSTDAPPSTAAGPNKAGQGVWWGVWWIYHNCKQQIFVLQFPIYCDFADCTLPYPTLPCPGTLPYPRYYIHDPRSVFGCLPWWPGPNAVNLPMLGNGQDPSSLIGQYQEGVLAKTTRLADLRGKLDIAAPAAPAIVTKLYWFNI